MKFIQFLLATFLLCIGLFLSYDKVEIINEDIKKVEQDDLSSIGEHVQTSTIIEDNSSNSQSELLMDESTSSENNITQSNNNVKKKSTTKKNKNQLNQPVASNNSNSQLESVPVGDNISQEKEEVKQEPKEENKKEETKPKCENPYESITHGKVDKSSKSACTSYGNKIQNNELDEVLDYNEENGNTRKPTISYFRCYEVLDDNCNTKGWYLHFFCNSGECSDSKLKSLYG